MLSFARAWEGRVECRLDNQGVISSWRRLRRPAPGAWTKVADRDVHGHIELLRQEAAGEWRVSHVKGHAERRKVRALWTLYEVGNDAVDEVARRMIGRCSRRRRRLLACCAWNAGVRATRHRLMCGW